MAQKVIVITEYTSDISGDPATHSFDFSIDTRDYHIDLTDDEFGRWREAVAPFVKVAQPIRVRAGKKKSPAKKAPNDAAAIRAWAKARGIEVSERGRIQDDVRRRYEAEKGEQPPATAPVLAEPAGTQ